MTLNLIVFNMKDYLIWCARIIFGQNNYTKCQSSK